MCHFSFGQFQVIKFACSKMTATSHLPATVIFVNVKSKDRCLFFLCHFNYLCDKSTHLCGVIDLTDVIAQVLNN